MVFKLDDVFARSRSCIETFRRAISVVIPEMTRVALLARKQEIVNDTPNFHKQRFLYYISRKSYEKEWGKAVSKTWSRHADPGVLLRLVPKVRIPGAGLQDFPPRKRKTCTSRAWILRSRNYSNLLHETKVEELRLPIRTATPAKTPRRGNMRLTDKAYEKLLGELADKHFEHLTPELQKEHS